MGVPLTRCWCCNAVVAGADRNTVVTCHKPECQIADRRLKRTNRFLVQAQRNAAAAYRSTQFLMDKDGQGRLVSAQA